MRIAKPSASGGRCCGTSRTDLRGGALAPRVASHDRLLARLAAPRARPDRDRGSDAAHHRAGERRGVRADPIHRRSAPGVDGERSPRARRRTLEAAAPTRIAPPPPNHERGDRMAKYKKSKAEREQGENAVTLNRALLHADGNVELCFLPLPGGRILTRESAVEWLSWDYYYRASSMSALMSSRRASRSGSSTKRA